MFKIDRRGGVQKSFTRTDPILIYEILFFLFNFIFLKGRVIEQARGRSAAARGWAWSIFKSLYKIKGCDAPQTLFFHYLTKAILPDVCLK